MGFWLNCLGVMDEKWKGKEVIMIIVMLVKLSDDVWEDVFGMGMNFGSGFV